MKNLYTIGETSKIVGVSAQMLRKYSNAGLVTPVETNPETGYRYYSFSQFHIIDRIRYLRTLGMSLKDIKEIVQFENLDVLTEFLKKRKAELLVEIDGLKKELDDVEWYIRYFRYLNKVRIPNVPYMQRLPERYILVVDYDGYEGGKSGDTVERDTIERVETKIMRLKNENNFTYYRQWGYMMDMDGYLRNQFAPKRYFIFLKEKPEPWNEQYMAVIPAGLYLCLWCSKKNDIHAEVVKSFYERQKKPDYALALEYENSLSDYKNCPYEYQSLIYEEE